MFDLVECAYFLDNIEPTFLPNYTNNNKKPYNININNTTAASSSSSFSLNNSKSNNFTTTVALAFSLKNSYSNNNTTKAAPEPTTFSLKNSNKLFLATFLYEEFASSGTLSDKAMSLFYSLFSSIIY
ncbi:hypothetical protein DICPUDRAFT_85025 [Dictyostelium purpureum]|uniref:Uncharacterized protein n=1 Tax=Dictyostelium purpureum TaxID=5786 RepID=F1A4G5_DICPU|nr:uncharacterized protein DICPUDRAFT_85025 [Dictyostelium purpureum]EGC28917.1 hypothetical protein DICPUDRAFT_85025 [Dictyostelium purpureum]|eukprot:XP_003294562.1 hypothetical protein DICPUDRAFT_85025 [Dictyostelium purpureum]